MNQSCKLKFRQDALRVRKLLGAGDPLGLTERGAGETEYDRHANKVLIILHKIKNGHQTQEALLAYVETVVAQAQAKTHTQPRREQMEALCAELLELAAGLAEEPGSTL